MFIHSKQTWSLLLSAIVLLTFSSCTQARDEVALQWANDVHRNMLMDARDLPDKIGEENLLWEDLKIAKYNFGIPPTIADGRVLMGSTRDAVKRKGAEGNSLLCYDLYTGERLWEVALPNTGGYGMACAPIVEGKRVYINNKTAYCLDLYGQQDGNDGSFKDEAAFLNLGRELEPGDPDIIWVKNYVEETGGIYMRHGSAGTPVIVGDQFWIPTSHGQGEVMNRHQKIFHEKKEVDDPEETPPPKPDLIVLDKNTGEWIAKDDITLPEVYHGQWASISAAQVDGRWLVFWGDGYGFLRAFELPEKKEGEIVTLKQVWQYDGNPKHHRYDDDGNFRRFPYAPWKPDIYGRAKDLGPNYHIGAPVYWNGKLYFAMGRDYNYDTKRGPGGEGSLHCIDPTGEGDITESGRVWMTTDVGRTANTVSITDDGLLFVSDNSSGLHCFNAKNGKKYWRYDLERKNFYCAPLVADGKVFVGVNRNFFILEASKKLKVLSENGIPGEAVAPTAVDGLLVVPTWHDIQVFKGPDFVMPEKTQD